MNLIFSFLDKMLSNTKRKSKRNIGDFGCGDGRLEEHYKNEKKLFFFAFDPLFQKKEETQKSSDILKNEIMDRIKTLIDKNECQVSFEMIEKNGKKFSFSNLKSKINKFEKNEEISQKQPSTISQINTFSSFPIYGELQFPMGGPIQQTKEFPNDLKKEPPSTQVLYGGLNGDMAAEKLRRLGIKVLESSSILLSVELSTENHAHSFQHVMIEDNTIQILKIYGVDDSKSRNCLSAKGWNIVSSSLLSRHLTSVTLSKNKIGLDEAIIIYVGLGDNIQELDLWDNQINSEVALYLVNHLLKSHQLTKLNFGENDLDSEGRILIKKATKDTDIEITLF